MSDLLGYLAAPPRLLSRVLDIRGRTEGLSKEWAWWQERTTLRLFTGDPYEAGREGPDRFLANHVLEEPDVILCLSWGEAELDAAEIGWDAYLARAWATAVGAAVDHDAACRAGMYTAERIAHRRSDAAAEWGEPLDARIAWSTAGWSAFSLGMMVDVVESEYGLIGFSPEPLEFDEVGERDPDCPACKGQPVFVPHSPGTVSAALCGPHHAQWDVRSADRIPSHEGEAKRALAAMMLAATQDRAPAGFWAGLDRVDPDSGHSQLSFLQRVAGWCREAGVDLDGVPFVDDAMTDAMPFALGAIARDVGIDAAVEAADLKRALLPSECWGPDMDLASILQDSGREQEALELLQHLVTHGREQPFVYHVAGEHYEEVGDAGDAELWFRKGLARAVALGAEWDADLAIKGMRRSLEQRGGGEQELQQLDELAATIEAGSVTSLRPGRNEPCLCDSGRKWKRCCG